MTCPSCGAEPCINPDFCATCRNADRRRARGEQPKYIESWLDWPADIPRDFDEMSLDALWARFNSQRTKGRAARSTVDALMFSLRRGVAALDEPDTRRRLSELSDDQAIEVGTRLRKLKPKIARAWAGDEVSILLRTRESLKK